MLFQTSQIICVCNVSQSGVPLSLGPSLPPGGGGGPVRPAKAHITLIRESYRFEVLHVVTNKAHRTSNWVLAGAKADANVLQVAGFFVFNIDRRKNEYCRKCIFSSLFLFSLVSMLGKIHTSRADTKHRTIHEVRKIQVPSFGSDL